MQTVHDRIKIARINKGLSQQTMADILGISQPGYQQIESGIKPDMKISTLIKLCNILDVSSDWLLGLTE